MIETMSSMDKQWHLAETDDEMSVTDFEVQLLHIFNGFTRWMEKCEHHANNIDLTGQEVVILHIVKMKDTPKSIDDIGKLLNRHDTHNLQYILHELVKKELVEKHPSSQSKELETYAITKKGIKDIDQYVNVRRKFLIDTLAKDQVLAIKEITKSISQLKSIYDEAEKAANSNISH